jgi:antitoxin component YwqK of YwqJK toxin-antitoxin module
MVTERYHWAEAEMNQGPDYLGRHIMEIYEDRIDVTELSSDGVIEKVYSIVNSEIHGEYKSYWRNGKLKECGSYHNGKRLSLYRWYDDDGELIQEI